MNKSNKPIEKIKNFNPKMIANKVMKYDRINDGPKRIDKKSLVRILEKVGKE